ncbi:MAG: alpha/beta hydrolase fold domain-containing protein [Mycobacteriales bacterium]
MRIPAPVVARVLGALVRPVLGPRVPVSVQRGLQDVFTRANRLPSEVTSTQVVLGGRPALRFDPPTPLPDRAVLWLHGGAFITGSMVTHRAFAAGLALASDVPVYLLDYRLAPEHRHPAAVDDAVAALDLVPQGRVVLGGDSAGGCLALLAALRQSRALVGLALVSPVVDATRRTAAAYTGTDVLITTAWLEQGSRAMFGEDAPDLLQEDLSALPPTVLHVSQHERLRREGELLAQRLLTCELVVLPGLWHDAHLQTGLVREADDAVARLGASITRLLT